MTQLSNPYVKQHKIELQVYTCWGKELRQRVHSDWLQNLALSLPPLIFGSKRLKKSVNLKLQFPHLKWK